jgi:hypothetical protein
MAKLAAGEQASLHPRLAVIDRDTGIHKDVFMRTTLDLPDELLKRAKIAAVERGVTLRELIGSALVRDLAAGPPPGAASRRARFPLFSSQQPGSLALTNADVARAEADEDRSRLDLPR